MNQTRLAIALIAFLASSMLASSASAMYDPGLGRFLSRDPLGFEGGSSSHYLFFSGKTVNRIEAMGTRDEYVERDASGRPVALVHNGPSTELVNFLKDNADSLQTVETVQLLQHNVDADEFDSLSKLKSLRNLELGDHPDEVKIALESLSKIAALSTTEQLSIFATGTEENFGWLESLPMLRSLTLSSHNSWTLGSKTRILHVSRLGGSR